MVVGPSRRAVARERDESFETFFRSHGDHLFGSLCLVTRNRAEAEELAQDAFLALWERWDRVRALDDPVGYLYKTAFNAARKRFRRASLALRNPVEAIRPTDPIEAVDARTDVGRALLRLTPRQRMAVVLTDLLQFTSEDAAGVLGVRAGTVRALASAARAALKTELGETG